MKVAHIALLFVLALLLAFSVVVAQVAFRLERTVLSYGFTYREIQRILDPLDDPEIHERTISEAFRFIRRSLSLGVPRELEPYIIGSAVDGFSAAWVRQTVGLWLVTAQQILHGKRDDVEFPLSLSPFKSSFLSAIRGEFTMAETMEITTAVDEIPTTFDLADEIPDGMKRIMLSVGRSMAFTQVLLQYIVPGLLIIACFFHGRVGSGLTATGFAFLLAGVPSLIIVYPRAGMIARVAARGLSAGLPDFLSWIGPGLEQTVRSVVESGRLTAVLVTAYGVIALLGGLYLVIRKGDPRIRVRGE